MPDNELKLRETWTYTSRRQDARLRLRYSWRDAEGCDRIYLKLKGSVIGGIYTVDAERKPDSETVSVWPGTLAYTGERTGSQQQRLEWELADKRARASAESLRLERRDTASSDFTDAIAPLRKLYAVQRTRAARTAFLAMILDELGR